MRSNGPGTTSGPAGIFARDPDTGQARWFYQTVPHDLYDYDSINELVLLDLDLAGKAPKVLVRPERNGYMYVLDRATGEVLAARSLTETSTPALGVDLKSGALQYNPEKKPVLGKVDPGDLSDGPRREGLESFRLVAAHRLFYTFRT